MMLPSAEFRLTRLHRLWRLLPAQQRRRLLTRATALLAPRINRTPLPVHEGIAIVGELSRASGLGEGARLMLRALQGLGVSTWPIDASRYLPGACSDFEPYRAAQPPALLPEAVPLVLHVNPPLLPLVLLRLPRSLVRGRRMIGYWSWELPVVPLDWGIGARFVHDLWVPSAFTAAALEPLLPGRVRVVAHPLAVAQPTPSALDRSAFGLPRAAVVVLTMFNLASSFERKNPLGAIAAFRAAFGNRPDRLLLLKISNHTHFPADFHRLATAVAEAPNIRLETQTLTTSDLQALIAACDIVLSLHRSEGFGLVPAEAMLLGKPVIATGWSGNMGFMDTNSAALVGWRLVPVEDPRGVYANAFWAEPDQAEAVAHLRQLADDSAERTALGARARKNAVARLGVGPLAATLRDLR